jgi:tetratricopeptide (TPR) repeat protein
MAAVPLRKAEPNAEADAYIAFEKACVSFGREEYREAAQLFREAATIKPDFVEAHFNLGMALMALRQGMGAAAAFRRATELNPDRYAWLYDGLQDISTRDSFSLVLDEPLYFVYPKNFEAFGGRFIIFDDPLRKDIGRYFSYSKEAMESAIDLNAAADSLGLSKERALHALEQAATEATRGRAKEPPRPDWIEAHKQGIEVPEFIEKTFPVELADGTMHRGMFDRYQNLRRDFHAYQRHHKLPEWLMKVPTKAEWDKEHAELLLPDEVRRHEREAKRARRRQGKAAVHRL